MSRAVLVDTTKCMGCRGCQVACKQANGNEAEQTEFFAKPGGYQNPPDLSAKTFSLVTFNEVEDERGGIEWVFARRQCMHCLEPSCVSACIVGALEKNPKGPVTYDADKCIGCRYCMVACPFQVPAYEYDNALTPKVMKCTMCTDRTLNEGKQPACVEMCPREALVFGRRSELLELARDRIRMNPDRYKPHVFGEYDGGGTSWLLLSDRDFTEVDLPDLPDTSPAEITEGIQHGIFRGFSGPLMMFGLISVLVKSMGDRDGATKEDDHE